MNWIISHMSDKKTAGLGWMIKEVIKPCLSNWVTQWGRSFTTLLLIRAPESDWTQEKSLGLVSVNFDAVGHKKTLKS